MWDFFLKVFTFIYKKIIFLIGPGVVAALTWFIAAKRKS